MALLTMSFNTDKAGQPYFPPSFLGAEGKKKRSYPPARNLQRFRRQEDKVAKRAVPVCSEIPQPGFHKIARSLPQEFP